MTKFLMNDEDYRLVKRMKNVQTLMLDVISDFRGVVPRQEEVIERIDSAAEKFAEAISIFVAESLMDYDEFIKENHLVKKDET